MSQSVSVAKTETRKTFDEIFSKLAPSLNTPLKSLRIGIELRNNATIYFPYIKGEKVSDGKNEATGKEKYINIALEDYLENAIVNGWATMIDMFINNLWIKFAKDAEADGDNISVILSPDVVMFKETPTSEEKEIFKWSLPKQVRDEKYPECNGLPLAMLAKKKNNDEDFTSANLQFVRKIDIESEIMM